jgi:acetyl esterase
MLRKRAGGVAIQGFFGGLAGLGKLHPQASPARHGVEVLHNIRYLPGDNPKHCLDVYRPLPERGPTPGKRPALLYIHGGGFRILSKDTHWLMGLAFARRGFVVFNVGYRLAPQHPFPAALHDVTAALEWLEHHAAEYGADLNQLVIAGESAGANLATSLAISTCFARPEDHAQAAFALGRVPKAVLPMCGVLQVTDPERFRRRRPERVGQFVQDRLNEVSLGYLGAERMQPNIAWQLADPLLVLESDARAVRPLPAFFAGVGTADVLLDDTRRLHTALCARQVHSEVRYYPKQVHAFHAMTFLPAARDCWVHQLEFLERVLQRPLPLI